MENQQIENYLRKRIAELNKTDADFCAQRWDESKPEHIRKMARENSNSVTLARQELESILKEMGLPRFLNEKQDL